MPTTVGTVAAWLELGAVAEPDPRAMWLAAIVPAVVDRIEARCTVPDPGVTWTPALELAGLMLASRLYKRRQSPGGEAGFDPVALAAVLAQDPDIAELIGDAEKLTGFA